MKAWADMSPEEQAQLDDGALRAHFARQGPADAPLLRRLVSEYALTHEAAGRMMSQGWAAAAIEEVNGDALLILHRLRVLTNVPSLATAATVLSAATALADLLDEVGESGGYAAAVDPAQRLDREGIHVPFRDPWTHTGSEVAEALLVS